MDLFNNALKLAGQLDLPALGARAGLTPDQVQMVVAALAKFQGQADPAQAAADDTGVPRSQIETILAQLGGPDAIAKMAGMLGGAGGIGGALGGLFGR